MKRLPPCRKRRAWPVQLRRFENMPYEEIARTLDMTVPATKSLLFRARNMLKDALASFLE